jgi:hypothetical protein
MTEPTFYTWPKLTAFDTPAIGSVVTHPRLFLKALTAAVLAFDFNAETNEHVTTTGQGAIFLPEGIPHVAAGVGPKSADVSRYVLREWRGEVKPFLKREHASAVESLLVIVYTVAAYLADPQVDASERSEIEAGGATHVIVAVLANAGPKPPAYSPSRLVANLAGGNNDALAWDADTIREHASAAQAYASEWSVVAD